MRLGSFGIFGPNSSVSFVGFLKLPSSSIMILELIFSIADHEISVS